jgi:HlyD family secretion protein
MAKKSWGARVVSVALIAGAAAFWFYRAQDQTLAVRTAVIDQGIVERTVANTRAGTVKACQRSKLAMQRGGVVASLDVKKGDRVKPGDVLLTLANDEFKARVKQAEAQLASARLAHDQACATADQHQRDANRAESLGKRNLLSEENRETALTRAITTRKACLAAEAQESMAGASLVMEQAMLEQTVLRAPFGGIVAEINGEIGEYVTPSPPGVPTPPAVDLIDDSCLYVTAPIDEVDASQLRTGLPARITLDAFRGRTFMATLTRIAPYVQELEKQARTVDVDLKLQAVPEDVPLLVGYSADAEIIVETREKVVRVPVEAVQEGDRVLVVNAEQRLESREIKTGVSNWTYREVLSGLKEGDQVLISFDVPGAVAGAKIRNASTVAQP